MKICMTSFFYGKGYGQGLCVKKLAEALSELGNEVHVIHGTETNEKKRKNLKLHFIETEKTAGMDFISFGKKLDKKMLELGKEKKFDLFYPQSYEFGLAEFEKLDAPIFYHARGTMKGIELHRPKSSFSFEIGKKIILPYFEKLDKKCCENAKKIFTPSETIKKELMEFYGASAEKIEVIPDGIDLKQFNSKIDSKKLRKELGLENAIVLVFSGRLVPQKGLQYLIEALPFVLRFYPNTILLVLGANTTENFEAILRKKAGELGLDEKVKFLGLIEQEKMQNYLSLADIVVLPSTYDPFGIAALEAMAMQKLVVTTNAVGSARFLEAGIIIAPNSAEQISSAIIKLLSNKKFFQSKIKNQQKKLKGLEWKHLAKKIEKTFKEELK